jgi:hypothetical protein
VQAADILVSDGDSIQTAVDGADPGDTICVEPGTYAEDVLVNKSVTLLSLVLHAANIQGTVTIGADNVTLDGFMITDFSQIPVTDWSGVFVPEGVGVVVSNNLIDGAAIDPVANLTVGVHTLFGGSAEITVDGNVVTNVRLGIYNQGADMLITDNLIEGTEYAAIGIDTDLGTVIEGNDIQDNFLGVEVWGENVTIHYNNIQGNDLGVENYSGSVVDATCNWWGAASGPGGEGSGSGDTVSEDVDFLPWLIAEAPDGACVGGIDGLIDDLIDDIEAANVHLEKQLTNALKSALHHLQAGRIAQACDALNRFIDHVDRQRGQRKGLTAAQADAWIDAAEAIKDALGC